MPLKTVEGYTGPLDFDLLANGVVDAALSTGDGLELVLKGRGGEVIATSGNVEWQTTTSSGGTAIFARYLPDAGDLRQALSPYSARFKVTRAGRVLFYPSDLAPDSWQVGPQ